VKTRLASARIQDVESGTSFWVRDGGAGFTDVAAIHGRCVGGGDGVKAERCRKVEGGVVIEALRHMKRQAVM
jgi:hypothetical protein